jgi:8-oxo-dGTP pyrophosphatase MutT (NUDIX family)
MIQPWRLSSSQPLGDYRVFSLRRDLKVSPRTGREHDFIVLDAPSWVNVVALTPDRRIILIEQYRQGSNTVELEIPGGIMDPSDTSPQAAGCRELAEETGCQGDSVQLLGEVFANPAIMNNRCFTVLARNCRPVKPVHFDECEDLLTKIVPVDDLPALVASGRIRHSLVVAALYLFDIWRKSNPL